MKKETEERVEKYEQEIFDEQRKAEFEQSEKEAGSKLSEVEKKIAKRLGLTLREYLGSKKEMQIPDKEWAKEQERVNEKMLDSFVVKDLGIKSIPIPEVEKKEKALTKEEKKAIKRNIAIEGITQKLTEFELKRKLSNR